MRTSGKDNNKHHGQSIENAMSKIKIYEGILSQPKEFKIGTKVI